MNKKYFIYSLLISITCVIFFIYFDAFKVQNNFKFKGGDAYFQVEMQSSSDGLSQVFYDIGNGFNEVDSSVLKVSKKGYQNYRFPLGNSSIKALRFDPINRDSKIKIKDPVILTSTGQIKKNIPLNSFLPISQISNITINENYIDIDIQHEANDPALYIEGFNVESQLSIFNKLAQHSFLYLKFFTFSLIIFLSLYFLYSRLKLLEFHQYPRATILFSAMLGTILSCYPVFFWGKSFIALAGLALYDAPPFIPGYSVGSATENFRGSDIGAMAWAIAPSATIQAQAIFDFHEFPFWNRFVGAGIPLFGQGQSMIGDPLHWLAILTRGNAFGWDLKFIAAKFVFTFGVGLLVLRLTRDVLSAALVCFSACFLGVFAYRFNHPVYFSLTYVPWVVLQYIRLPSYIFERCTLRQLYFQLITLALFFWLQLNAGSPKEGIVLLLFACSFGGVLFLERSRSILAGIIVLLAISLAEILISAPYWLVFLDTLKKSLTNYDAPSVATFPIWSLIAFYENYIEQSIIGRIAASSVNMYVFFGMSCSLIYLALRNRKIFFRKNAELIAWGFFMLALCIAYGLFPDSLVLRTPFLNQIHHVGDTFTLPMLFFGLLICGYGVSHYLKLQISKRKVIENGTLVLLILVSLPLAIRVDNWKGFSVLMSFSIIIFATAFIFQSRINNKNAPLSKWVLVIIFAILNFHHGLSLKTNTVLDEYMVNPENRPNFNISSPSLDFIKNLNLTENPTRIIGEGKVLFPGYNERLDIESVVAVDALRNKYFENILNIVDFPDVGWGWLRSLTADQMKSHKHALNILGVGYVLSMPGVVIPADLALIFSGDLNVWKNHDVWPRAFFTDKIYCISGTGEVNALLEQNKGSPIAFLDRQACAEYEIEGNSKGTRVIPAKDYALTTNSTAFKVNAPHKGIVVLSEGYYPDDYIATINGKQAVYFRVNEAFKGVLLDSPGEYEIKFLYRPRYLYVALIMSLIGIINLMVIALFCKKFIKN